MPYQATWLLGRNGSDPQVTQGRLWGFMDRMEVRITSGLRDTYILIPNPAHVLNSHGLFVSFGKDLLGREHQLRTVSYAVCARLLDGVNINSTEYTYYLIMSTFRKVFLGEL